MCERAATDVMIDADEKPILEAFEAGALDAVALENDCGVVVAVDPIGLHYAVSEWQSLVDARNDIMEHHVGVLAHAPENLATG
jgi:hypothetical protein